MFLTYAIVGTGGIGGYYGGCLAKAGHPVHFLLHSDYEYVLKNEEYEKAAIVRDEIKKLEPKKDIERGE